MFRIPFHNFRHLPIRLVMKGKSLANLVLVMGCSSLLAADADSTSTYPSSPKVKIKMLEYPKTETQDVVDEYHGRKVSDPYRWLEDTESKETASWVVAQNAVTFDYLNQLPQKAAYRERLTALWNYERFGLPTRHGSEYFFTHNSGLQNQSVLYVTTSLDGSRRQLLDPNKLRDDGTVNLSGIVPSDDGQYLAYGLATAGSDWNTWHVRNVKSTEDEEDKLEWIKFSSVAWTKDGKGFFYSRFDEPTPGQEFQAINYYQKLFYHRLGTPQSDDRLIYKRDDQKDWGFGATVSEDGAFLIIEVSRGTEDKKLVFFSELPGGVLPEQSNVTELISEFKSDYSFIGNDGQVFYFFTDNDAARGKVISVDLKAPQPENWKTIIPEMPESIESIALFGNTFFVNYLQDATSLIRRFKINGERLEDLELPGIGTVTGFNGKRDNEETFYTFTNYITPPTIYRHDFKSGKNEVWRQSQVDFDPQQFETKRVFFKSKDGTSIPMILNYKKGLQLTGSNKTMLYAYGGFNISLTPSFSPSNIAWMERGGIYAVPNLRGGGEYGREWHEAGMLDRKQNVFDDFIAAAEYLISEKYTDSKHLAIMGGSNGGLLVGAVMTQRPDLYAVAVPRVGVLDMLRFHKFTIGWAWVNEYGSSDDSEQFKNLYAYSPLHNLKPNTPYPATLVMTADHDDRVVPGHSFKFAARLQEVYQGTNPTLIRIETRAGHGAGTPVTKLIEAASDSWAFVEQNLGGKDE